MTDTISIPLNRLVLWRGNVRRTGAQDGIPELAASIAAHGLLQSLVVRKGKRGKYEIVAGQRRYLALSYLAKSRFFAADHPVPCILASDSVDSTELSLAENVIRAPMHPADQFEAFRALADGGASPADIAARFGMSELAVSQRLRLGRLSPVILEAYRNGDLTLDAAQAFTVTDDHAAQERVFGDLTSWNRNPNTIRRALTEDEVPTSNKRVRFVGIDAYVAAGGAIRKDLFAEDDAGYVTDVELLDRLVAEKLETVATEVAREGWRWVDTATDLDHQALSRFERRYPEQTDLSPEDQAALDELVVAYDNLVDDDDADEERLADLSARIDALNAKTEAWDDDTRALAGVLVTLDYDGDVRIDRGLVRKTDLPKANADGTRTGALSGDSEELPSVAPGLSPTLVEDLTAERTAAIAATLVDHPDVALAAVVHALVLDLAYPGHGGDTCLRLDFRPPSLRTAMARPEASKALASLAEARERIGDTLPGHPAQLWAWCLARSRDELVSLLAVVTAHAVDAIRRKADRADCARLRHADALSDALSLDMTTWYTPTAEGYFARVQRAHILAAIDEAKGGHGPALDKLKKGDLAVRAAQIVAGTGWLPAPLRAGTASGADIGSEAADDEFDGE